MNKRLIHAGLLLGLLLGGCMAAPTPMPTPQPTPVPTPVKFSGERAFSDVQAQIDFGARTPGSPAHAQTVDWIVSELQAAGWQTRLQETNFGGFDVRNIIAERGEVGAPWVVIGAHYDSRMLADEDADAALAALPVPGANDGASGVAVLLELARTLPPTPARRVSLAFFDMEDQGGLAGGYQWILGSGALAQEMAAAEPPPDAVIVIDMIGDADLEIKRERYSNPQLLDELFAIADELGYAQYFVNEPGFAMIDDHTPFLKAGIAAVDLIDFTYPYWHTSQDTPDKVAPQSLQMVGDVLTAWLVR